MINDPDVLCSSPCYLPPHPLRQPPRGSPLQRALELVEHQPPPQSGLVWPGLPRPHDPHFLLTGLSLGKAFQPLKLHLLVSKCRHKLDLSRLGMGSTKKRGAVVE